MVMVQPSSDDGACNVVWRRIPVGWQRFYMDPPIQITGLPVQMEPTSEEERMRQRLYQIRDV